MPSTPLRRACAVAALLAAFSGAATAQQPSMEERLRAQLRATTEQLQAAQNELATLKARAVPAPVAAAPAAPAVDTRALERELGNSRTQLAREREARSHQEQQLAEVRQEAQAGIGRANAQAAQYKTAYDGLLKMARASEAERQRLAGEGQFQTAALAQCQAKNQQLYGVGQELLRAYEGIDMGTLVRVRQPFAAKVRVQYEQIAQQYGDQLYEGRFDLRSVNAPAAAAAPAPAAPQP